MYHIFMFQTLNGYEIESRLISIKDWRKSYFEDADFSLLWFWAKYPHSFMGFG